MIEWVEQLRSDFTAEFGTAPKVATLATVDRKRMPHARTVVVRAVRDVGSLVVASDARAEKTAQLRRRPVAEACVWLARVRRQYRLTCRVGIIGEHGSFSVSSDTDLGEFRHQVWGEMSEASRALFFWPDPGAPRISDGTAFPEAVRTGLPPTNFELLYLLPSAVDVLDLNGHPHRRRRWVCDVGWTACEINP